MTQVLVIVNGGFQKCFNEQWIRNTLPKSWKIQCSAISGFSQYQNLTGHDLILFGLIKETARIDRDWDQYDNLVARAKQEAMVCVWCPNDEQTFGQASEKAEQWQVPITQKSKLFSLRDFAPPYTRVMKPVEFPIDKPAGKSFSMTKLPKIPLAIQIIVPVILVLAIFAILLLSGDVTLCTKKSESLGIDNLAKAAELQDKIAKVELLSTENTQLASEKKQNEEQLLLMKNEKQQLDKEIGNLEKTKADLQAAIEDKKNSLLQLAIEGEIFVSKLKGIATK